MALHGTWSTMLLSVLQLRYHTYTFTPAAGQCALSIYNEYCDHYADHTNVYANRSALSEQYCTNFTININLTVSRYMVTCYYQYFCAGSTTYTFTTLCRSVCSAIYNEYCDHYPDHIQRLRKLDHCVRISTAPAYH
jgi:hypothetical protein